MKHALYCVRRSQLRRYGASKHALRTAMRELTKAREQVEEGIQYINALVEIVPSEIFNDAVLAGKLNGIRAYLETAGTDEYRSLRAENERLRERCEELESRLDIYHGNMYDVVVAKNAELTATVERMRGLLRRVEWCDDVRDEAHNPVPGCWFCEQPETDGHADDCELKRELG